MKIIFQGALSYLLMIFLITGCKSEKPNNDYNQNMIFDIDSSMIEPQIKDTILKITYSPPVHWKVLSEKMFERVKSGIKEQLPDSQYVKINPVAFYADDSLKGVLSLSTIDFGTDGKAFNERMIEYGKMLDDKFNGNIKHTVFTKDHLKFKQFLIQTTGQVIFKMLFENRAGQVLQFDYISDRQAYINMIKAIESSIGSIQYTVN